MGHTESMEEICVVQELLIFMARWEKAVERALPGIVKASEKQAKKMAKRMLREMTRQVRSRVIFLGGVPAQLCE